MYVLPLYYGKININQRGTNMYIVMEASAHMPSSCKAWYRKIAVVQLTQEYTAQNKKPRQISDRDRGIVRVVRIFPPVPAAGRTEHSGLVQTRKAAKELAYQLNNVRDAATAEQIIGAGGSA